MAARYTDTLLWSEDWFWDLGGEYQLFFKYICDTCDNVGVWKPNKIGFEVRTKFKINLDNFLKKINGGKELIIVLENGRWFIPGFIKFQWFNKKEVFVLSLGNKLHNSLYNLLLSNSIPIEKVRGLKEVLKTSMVMDKDKEIELLEKLKAKKEIFKKSLEPFLQEYGKDTLNDFFRYWAEATPNMLFLKYEKEETWELKLRLKRWLINSEKFK